MISLRHSLALRLAAVMLGTSLLMLPGCKSGDNGDKTTGATTGHGPNVVQAHLSSDPPSLHTINAANAPQIYIFEYTQRTLTRTDLRTQKQIPVLVKSLGEPGADKQSYTYELRDDVKWDDGSPLTAEDVAFTVKVTLCPASDNTGRRAAYENIKDISVDPANPRRFTLHTKSVNFLDPYLFNELYIAQRKAWDPKNILAAYTIPQMADPKFSADSKPEVKAWFEDFNGGPAGHSVERLGGLGPYKVTDWQAGSSITLTRKQNWWGEKDTSIYSRAYPEKIVYNIIPEDNSVAANLKNGKLDVVVQISTSNFKKLQETPGFTDKYHMGMTDQMSYNVLVLNTRDDRRRNSILSDVKVRRALAYLLPVDEINKTAASGLGTRLVSFIPPSERALYNDSLPLIPYDADKAAKLLDEAGWKDTDGDNIRDKVIRGKKTPLRLDVYFGNQPANKNISAMIKETYDKAGVGLNLNSVEFADLQQKLEGKQFDIILLSLSGGKTDDPYQLHHRASPDNLTGYGSVEIDRLIDQIRRETDETKRIPMMKRMQAMVYEGQPYIYLYGVKRKIIISKRFDNPLMFVERPGVLLSNLKLKEDK